MRIFEKVCFLLSNFCFCFALLLCHGLWFVHRCPCWCLWFILWYACGCVFWGLFTPLLFEFFQVGKPLGKRPCRSTNLSFDFELTPPGTERLPRTHFPTTLKPVRTPQAASREFVRVYARVQSPRLPIDRQSQMNTLDYPLCANSALPARLKISLIATDTEHLFHLPKPLIFQ